MAQPTNPNDGAWIGVDLDGTLAYYDHWRGVEHIGPPIPMMVLRVKQWLSKGVDVRIFTARVSGQARAEGEIDLATIAINAWCQEHLGQYLPITCCKDYGMVELWDDRAIQVEHNTGLQVTGEVDLGH